MMIYEEMRCYEEMHLTKASIKPTKDVILKSFKKEKRIYVHGLHDIPFAMLLLTMFGPRKRQKVQNFLIQKVEKNTIHFYCSQITIHELLFTNYCSLTLFTLTVHSKILPI